MTRPKLEEALKTKADPAYHPFMDAVEIRKSDWKEILKAAKAAKELYEQLELLHSASYTADEYDLSGVLVQTLELLSKYKDLFEATPEPKEGE